ncbi:MAG: zinc ABC transporter substrate-binding protein [Candidatus Nitrosotenuis sp.]
MKKSILATLGGGAAIAMITVLWLAQTTDAPENQSTTSEPNAKQAGSKLRVVASFYPLYEFSKNVGGDKAEISSFVPVGVEPHDWDPSSGDILRLKKADVFVYNGAGFEPFVEQIIESGEYKNLAFVESTKGIALEQSDSGYDPHVWLDPVLAKRQVETIKAAMIQADPQNSQYYEANAAAYGAKLDELDAKIRSELSGCKKDTFMPFHMAFTYFADRYGLKIFALSGVAPNSEATAAKIKEFVDFVKENEIKVIFAEDLIDPRLAEVLADEARVQVMILSPVEGLTQEDTAAAKTYISKMEENLANLKVALDCQ